MVKISVGIYKMVLFKTSSNLVDLFVFIVLIIFVYWIVYNWSKKGFEIGLKLIFLWLTAPIVFFSFYQGHIPDYYFLLSFPPFILFCSYFFMTFLAKGKIFSVLLIVLLIIFTVINCQQVFTVKNHFSLKYKKMAVSYIIQKSQNQPFRLSFTTSPGLEHGFNYLFFYYQGKITDDSKAPIFTIIVPQNYQKIIPDITFGDIGVIGPRYE